MLTSKGLDSSLIVPKYYPQIRQIITNKAKSRVLNKTAAPNFNHWQNIAISNLPKIVFLSTHGVFLHNRQYCKNAILGWLERL